MVRFVRCKVSCGISLKTTCSVYWTVYRISQGITQQLSLHNSGDRTIVAATPTVIYFAGFTLWSSIDGGECRTNSAFGGVHLALSLNMSDDQPVLPFY